MSGQRAPVSRQEYKRIAGMFNDALEQIEADDPAVAAVIRRYVASVRTEAGYYRTSARDAQAALLAIQAAQESARGPRR